MHSIANPKSRNILLSRGSYLIAQKVQKHLFRDIILQTPKQLEK